ncbi:peptidyl-tRNA hydrolase, mitochondrial isoform X2 [Chenopodium quinoa]|uniref:peptidyl-tRNA hydrolase, mitochondrial isoform X2 n=1 Tax=Chenopodium quinoa TaxID=63459 RepID=UPI000B794AFE|nr:peptidyl-tRNA hydrolase, mitochondrial isoform X2 [Chenopodium quinoa]
MLRWLSRENSAVGRSLSTCVNPPLPWLFVGLGNPGDKFKGTRHNVGFEMIDALADSLGISLNNVHCKALFAQGPLAAYYKLPLNRVMVFHDDKELPCGVLRLQHNGGHSSHNGLKSVINHFRGNRDFARLRIGIGRPPGQMDPKAFLLQKFNSLARERIDAALKEGVDVLKLMPSEGFMECARWFNSEQKYKHIRPHTTFKLESMDNHLAP